MSSLYSCIFFLPPNSNLPFRTSNNLQAAQSNNTSQTMSTNIRLSMNGTPMSPSSERNERSKTIKRCPHHHRSIDRTPLPPTPREDQPGYQARVKIQTDLKRSEAEMEKQVRQAQAALKQDYKTRKEALDEKLRESKAANEILRQELQKSPQAIKGETGRKCQVGRNGRGHNRQVSST